MNYPKKHSIVILNIFVILGFVFAVICQILICKYDCSKWLGSGLYNKLYETDWLKYAGSAPSVISLTVGAVLKNQLNRCQIYGIVLILVLTMTAPVASFIEFYFIMCCCLLGCYLLPLGFLVTLVFKYSINVPKKMNAIIHSLNHKKKSQVPVDTAFEKANKWLNKIHKYYDINENNANKKRELSSEILMACLNSTIGFNSASESFDDFYKKYEDVLRRLPNDLNKDAFFLEKVIASFDQVSKDYYNKFEYWGAYSALLSWILFNKDPNMANEAIYDNRLFSNSGCKEIKRLIIAANLEFKGFLRELKSLTYNQQQYFEYAFSPDDFSWKIIITLWFVWTKESLRSFYSSLKSFDAFRSSISGNNIHNGYPCYYSFFENNQ